MDRVSSIAAKYIGRPVLQLPPVQPFHMSSLDLSMASYGGRMHSGPSLDLDLLTGGCGASSSSNINPDPLPIISDMDKSLMAEIATNAMEEFISLVHNTEPLWIKGPKDGGIENLNIDNYRRIFPRPNYNPNLRTEASRVSGVVAMNTLKLVDMFVDSVK